jgi:NADPH-dependent 2,4-dienoyl-CoA reductase/sulfur reductase-like enzyme
VIDFFSVKHLQLTKLTGTMEIIIVGAGIAGLSAGIGLRRAGHKVTVCFLFPFFFNPLNFLKSVPDLLISNIIKDS